MSLDEFLANGSAFANVVDSDLAEKGESLLIDKRIECSSDLAAMAQIYRDIRHETFRIIYMDEDSRVVAANSITYGLPNRAPAWNSDKFNCVEHYFRDQLSDQNSIKSVWLLHNHPTGSSNASIGDKMVTRTLVEVFDQLNVKFNGHVIINSKTFSVIHPEQVEDLESSTYDLDPSNVTFDIEQERANKGLFLEQINHPRALAKAAKSFQSSDDYFTLIGVNNKFFVNAVMEVDYSFLELPRNKVVEKLFDVTKASGSLNFLLVNLDMSKVGELGKNLLGGDTPFLDYLTTDGRQFTRIKNRSGELEFKRPIKETSSRRAGIEI